MPSGSYLLSGHEGVFARERFICEEGPDGWSYVGVRSDPRTDVASGRIDLLVAPDGRVLRLEVSGGGWTLRGGVVGGEALWRRGDEERSAAAAGFTGTSPSYAVVANRLAVQEADLRLVEVHDAALATRLVDQRWTGADGVWRSEVLDTGAAGRWRVVDSVVADGPGVLLEQ